MATLSQHIVPSEPRDRVRVTLSHGNVLEGAIGTTIEAFFEEAIKLDLLSTNHSIIAAICDGRLRELTRPLESDANIQPVTIASSDGGRIYRRSLVLLMATAISELWERVQVNVNYALADGGFFCEVVHRQPFTMEEVVQLENRMNEIVAEDNRIDKQIVPLPEAVDIFRQRGDEDKVRLLQYRTREDLTLYKLRGHADYYYGYMVPSTGYLDVFRLIHAENGFILQYPRSETPNELRPITALDKLSQVFHQTDEWLEKLGVEDIGRLNQHVRDNKIRELILVAEALHEQNIASIAAQVFERHQEGNVRIILIAGPSSSGKTTFAKRLAIQLLAHGLHPFTLEMDNYFVDRIHTPRDADGDYDFESIEALNLKLFNKNLIGLMSGEQVRIPKFDFHTGTSSPGQLIQIHENQIIILEGIHGLNPALIPDIPSEAVFRIYVSALTGLNIDMHNRVPTTDLRLLRRIVRDARHRGYNATETLDRWRSVRRGEKHNIFPYQENADAMFNSALVYELAAIRSLVEPLLLQVEVATPPHIEANRLLSFLRWVQPLTQEQRGMIPDTSLLREFIGDSILSDYHPGKLMQD